MRPYLEWLDEDGFYIKDAWDEEKRDFGPPGRMILFPKYRRILTHALQIKENGRFAYETILFSDIKKTGKTVISASIAAWYAESSRPGTEIYVIANTKEQGAGRVFQDLKFHFTHRQGMRGHKFCKIGQYRIDFPDGTFIQVLAQNYAGAAGSRHALVLFDELWGSVTELDRRLWDEMVPIPTVPMSLRVISSYAGFENESELLWSVYLKGVGMTPEGIMEHEKGQGKVISSLSDLPCWENGKQFTYWSHESDLPWYTEEFIEEQRNQERPSAFIRLFTNNWVTSHEEFIPIEWWDRAAKNYTGPATIWGDHPFKRWPITLGIDAGIRRDSTALVGVAYDAARGRVGIVFHKIWTPTEGDPLDLEITLKPEILNLYNTYTISSLVYDPTHLLPMMMDLKRQGIPTSIFDQTVSNMTAASQCLFDLLKGDLLEAYPADDLRRHIQMSVAETTSRGFRIVKTKVSKSHQIDGAIALAMACYDCVTNGGVDISKSMYLESPFSDMTAWAKKPKQDLPPELQTDEEY